MILPKRCTSLSGTLNRTILNAVTICGNLYDGPPSPSRAAIPKRRARRPIVRVSSHLAKVLPKPQFVTACGIAQRMMDYIALPGGAYLHLAREVRSAGPAHPRSVANSAMCPRILHLLRGASKNRPFSGRVTTWRPLTSIHAGQSRVKSSTCYGKSSASISSRLSTRMTEASFCTLFVVSQVS